MLNGRNIAALDLVLSLGPSDCAPVDGALHSAGSILPVAQGEHNEDFMQSSKDDRAERQGGKFFFSSFLPFPRIIQWLTVNIIVRNNVLIRTPFPGQRVVAVD